MLVKASYRRYLSLEVQVGIGQIEKVTSVMGTLGAKA